MDFSVDQSFAAGPEAVVRAYASPELYAQLGTAGERSKLGHPEVVSHRVDGTTVELAVRYRFVGHLPSAVTAVVDPRRLSWVEHSTHDLAEGIMRFRIEPDHYGDRLQASGQATVVARAGGGSRRTLTGSVRVRVLLAGPRVERVMVSGMRDNLAAEAPLVDRIIATGTG
jgi:Protein of unknown function (DUF2505)